MNKKIDPVLIMAKSICGRNIECARCRGYRENKCTAVKFAKLYYNAGYREQTELANEILTAAEKIIDERMMLERRRAWEANGKQKEAITYTYTENALSIIKLLIAEYVQNITEERQTEDGEN